MPIAAARHRAPSRSAEAEAGNDRYCTAPSSSGPTWCCLTPAHRNRRQWLAGQSFIAASTNTSTRWSPRPDAPCRSGADHQAQGRGHHQRWMGPRTDARSDCESRTCPRHHGPTRRRARAHGRAPRQITTIHNSTNTNVVVDAPHKDLRRTRSALLFRCNPPPRAAPRPSCSSIRSSRAS